MFIGKSSSDFTFLANDPNLEDKHFELIFRDQKVFIKDNNSKSGTWVSSKWKEECEITNDLILKIMTLNKNGDDIFHQKFKFTKMINSELE
jgi:hypothetical protein